MAVDLFTWPQLRDAQQRAEAAEAERVAAQRRYYVAPHGQRQARLRALQEASQEALKASVALAALRREAGR